MLQSSIVYTKASVRLQLSSSSDITGSESPASDNVGSLLMHADGVGNIGYRAAAITTQFAPCSQQGDPRRVFLRFSASTQKPFCLLPRRSSASKLKLVTVSRATVSRYGSDYPRQTVTSDRDGTLGPQSRVPTDDVVALNSSASRPPLTTSPLTTSVVRSYEVPLWGRSSCRAILVICKMSEESLQDSHI